ncbi:MAG: nuclear transport factor 2 family protein [Lysobacterales bacterium]
MSASRAAIYALMCEYCYRIDAGDLDGFASLFEHASFEIVGDPYGPLHGSEAVREMVSNVTLYDGKPLSKHVLSNVLIEVDEANAKATAQSYVTVFQAVPPDFPLQPVFIGHYRDRFERVDGNWRFAARSISPDLIGDLSRHRADMAEEA